MTYKELIKRLENLKTEYDDFDERMEIKLWVPDVEGVCTDVICLSEDFTIWIESNV